MRQATTCDGPHGGAGTRPAPGTATTSGASCGSEVAAPPPARRLGGSRAQRDDPGMTAAPEALTQPARHVLALPNDCDCGMCTPSWARRRGRQKRHSELVTLTSALDREESAARPGMVAQHLACLAALATAATRAITDDPGGELGTPEVGLPVLMFAGELAAAIQPSEYRDQLPTDLVAACEQVITTATVTAAASLAGLVDAIQALSALTS